MKKALKAEYGQGILEYVLIIGLIGMVVCAILLILGKGISNIFSNLSEILKHY